MRGGWFRVPGSRECRRTLRGPIRSVRRGRPCAGPPNGRPPGSPLRWPVSRATTRVAPLWSETERHGVSRPLTVEVARVQQARRIRGFRAHRGPVGFALGEAESVIRMDESTRGRAPGSQRVVCAPDLCDMRLLGRQPESGPSLQRLFQEAGSANRSSLSLLRNSVAGCSARRIGDLLGLPRSTAPSPAVPILGLYEGRLRDLIHLYKFRSARALAWPLSDCLQKHFADLEFKGLVPVPSHPGRIRARGFDAVGLMARRLSRKCRVPVANALARVRATRPQFGLNGPARVRNLRGAFRMKRGEQLPVGNLLVLDDVLTTGTTISELASVIAAQRGVREVCALTLARTPLFGDSGC